MKNMAGGALSGDEKLGRVGQEEKDDWLMVSDKNKVTAATFIEHGDTPSSETKSDTKSSSSASGSGETKTEEAKVRYWRNMDGMNCIGRYIPDPKLRSEDETSKMEAKRPYTRGEPIVDTEINIQLGSLTLNTSRLEVLDSRIAAFPEFKQVFGENSGQVQCAPVKITTKRSWVRLVGTRHDVQFWHPDDRTPRLFPFVRQYAPERLPGTYVHL
jgi:hypothetical protein